MFQISQTEVMYLLDIFKEIQGGVDEGVVDEMEHAIELLENLPSEEVEIDELITDN